MRKASVLMLVLGLVLILAAPSARAVSTAWPIPTLIFTPGAQLSPKALPKRKEAPVVATIFGSVKTTDGTHPSALREAVIDVDKDATVNATGLAACGRRQLEGRTTQAARKVCHGAIVGSGETAIQILPAEGPPTIVSSPLVLFNGGTSDGVTTLLGHAFLAAPTPATVVTPVKLQRKGTGLHSIVRIPPIADGRGSLLQFSFELGRTYTYEDEKVGYLEARCPDGNFKVNVKKVLFKNEANVPGVGPTTSLKGGLVVPCTPKR